MNELTIEILIQEAQRFAEEISQQFHPEILGTTDGKAIGTYIEKHFKEYLAVNYTFVEGNAARGIDLPSVNTDIKVTSLRQPQSSCPFRSAGQKIFGLGYHLLVFVYDKTDEEQGAVLDIINTTFIDEVRTADYTMTRTLIDMLDSEPNIYDIIGYLGDRMIPGDEIEHQRLAQMILEYGVQQGYLTISNALQWRLQYARVIGLDNTVGGVINFDR